MTRMNSQMDPFLSAERENRIRSEEYFARGKIVALCESVLAEEIGVIAASRRLVGLGLSLFDDHDKDFVIFNAIASETDDLPVDRERQNWSVEALARKDKEIAHVEALYREDAFGACRELIKRFSLKENA